MYLEKHDVCVLVFKSLRDESIAIKHYYILLFVTIPLA